MGRTGRAGQAGTAISLLGPSDVGFAAELEDMLAGSGDAAQQAQQQQAVQGGGEAPDSGSDSDDEDGAARRGGGRLQPHPRITTAAVEGLRYRAEDVARSITKNVIKEVRPGARVVRGGAGPW